jgi:hypothetical protein
MPYIELLDENMKRRILDAYDLPTNTPIFIQPNFGYAPRALTSTAPKFIANDKSGLPRPRVEIGKNFYIKLCRIVKGCPE